MWGGPNDPQIYGSIDIDATAVRDHIATLRAAGRRVTVTHAVGRALALAIAAVPDLNVRLVAGYALPRASVDIFFITSVEGGHDLSGIKIESVDRKSLVAVSEELASRAVRLKRGEDRSFKKTKRLMDTLPKVLLRGALGLSAFLAGDLDRSVRALSIERAPFGSAMVSSVGMFGLPMGFAPLAWTYRVPLLVLVGEVTEKPVVIDGRVAVRPILPICATIDHRYVDGWHVSKLLTAFRGYLESPAAFEPV